ncbi:hypothetical protein LTR95_006358 [Oleoguttula sp. CCFEE 5521]
MADNTNDPNPAILNLSPDEKRAFGYLFNQADSDQLGVVTGERAVSFFQRTSVSPTVLGEIWQIADTENRGLLTRPGFCIVLRLIGHYQAGREPSTELAFKQGPIPKFDGLTIPGTGGNGSPAGVPMAQSPTGGGFPPNALQPQVSGQGPIRVPPLDAQKAQQYAGLFERSGAQGGVMDGGTAKAIFEKAGLPNEVLGKIWMLSDREQHGALNQNEFIVAMHLLTSMKSRSMTALPGTLPPGLYEAAARRGAPPPPGSRQVPTQTPVSRQFTGGSIGAPPRAQSPLAKPPGYATPPPQVTQATGLGPHWLITAQEKAKFDQFFATVDTGNRGVVTGEQAVRFFSDSGLPEDTLASIWDLADIRSEGQLNRDEFAVAMYLIRQQRAPNAAPLPAFLPSALVPPGMRTQNIQQQTQQTTAPAFDNASNTSGLPKSAADDLFGLDEPSAPGPQQPVLQPQATGASTSRDPFGGSSVPASPSSPQQRFQSQAPQSGSVFKPFMPTSAFGASIAQQNTGGSMTSSQGQARGFAPPTGPPPPQARAQQSGGMDDLLGDNDAHAAESGKLTNETTELANMSNQIGNLRSQMEQTQQKKTATQADVTATSTQKRDLETRLQQFRAQYEQEARTVKELEQQLTTSRESTKKLGQELAMLEGGYQDLQAQHQTIGQALQADQTENANLKQRIGQLNAEVNRLKPEIEKMKLDARQQKGLVSINKKQLTTNESALSGLQSEKADLEREATERAEAAARSPPPEPTPVAAPREAVVSPAGSTMSSTNPFFRKTSTEPQAERSMSPAVASPGAPNPSAFDQLFGPSFAQQAGSRSGTPPVTSFGARPAPVMPRDRAASGDLANSVGTMSSDGRPTPSATPPLSERAAKESPVGSGLERNADNIPPPPEKGQFTPAQLPVGGLRPSATSESSSTRVLPPASRAGGTDTPRDFDAPIETPGLRGPSGAFGGVSEGLPGAFPETPAVEQPGSKGPFGAPSAPPNEISKAVEPSIEAPAPTKDLNTDFDNAFAGFGAPEASKSAESRQVDDPFAPKELAPAASGLQSRGFGSEFPPIRSLEHDEEDSDSDDESTAGHGFGDNFGAAAPISQATAPSVKAPEEAASVPAIATGSSLAPARPDLHSGASTASVLPSVDAQQSPPGYDASEAQVGHGDRSGSNQFPQEYSGLLPARDVTTSPTGAASPPPLQGPALAGSTTMAREVVSASPPPAAVDRVQEIMAPEQEHTQREESGRSLTTPSTSLFPAGATAASPFGTASTTETFHDAFSRPTSSFTDIGAAANGPTSASSSVPHAGVQTTSQPNAFDDFDDFDDLAEAKEADKSMSDLDFGFGNHSRENSEFNTAFDSPAASMTTTTADSQATPRQLTESSSGFASGFGGSTAQPPPAFGSGTSSLQQTPQNAQHDWDAIFSGLDSSANGDIDTSLNGAAGSTAQHDAWGFADSTPASSAAPAPSAAPATTSAPVKSAPDMGRALTPGTEHDDPILKRLTGLGYPRNDALKALEQYDYDIERAEDHLLKQI